MCNDDNNLLTLRLRAMMTLYSIAYTKNTLLESERRLFATRHFIKNGTKKTTTTSVNVRPISVAYASILFQVCKHPPEARTNAGTHASTHRNESRLITHKSGAATGSNSNMHTYVHEQQQNVRAFPFIYGYFINALAHCLSPIRASEHHHHPYASYARARTAVSKRTRDTHRNFIYLNTNIY